MTGFVGREQPALEMLASWSILKLFSIITVVYDIELLGDLTCTMRTTEQVDWLNC